MSLFVSSFGSANFAVSFCFALQASPSLPVSIFSTRRDKASDLDLGDRCANERFVPDKNAETSTGREQYVPEPLMSHLFDMFFWMARVGMCLHTLVFGCLWFAFCRSNDMKGKGEM